MNDLIIYLFGGLLILSILKFLKTKIGQYRQKIKHQKKAVKKGKEGEDKVIGWAETRLDPNVYFMFNNITLPFKQGTTQIDHIVFSIYGIFVIETKNMDGFIFGDEDNTVWTQTFANGKKYPFNNPIKQNKGHLNALGQLLDLAPYKLKSLVLFVGDSVLKTDLPDYVMIGKSFAYYIRSFQDVLFTEDELIEMIALVDDVRLEVSDKTDKLHIQNLKKRFIKKHKVCTKCGDLMVPRMAKKGDNIGQEFLGCASYPKCKNIEQLK